MHNKTDNDGRAHVKTIHASDDGDRGSLDPAKVNLRMETETRPEAEAEPEPDPDLAELDLVADSGDFEVINLFLAHRDEVRRGEINSP